MMPATLIRVSLLQIFEESQRFDRAHFIDVQRADFLFDFVRARLEKANLHGARAAGFGESCSTARCSVFSCSVRTSRARSMTLHGQTRQARDFDAVTAIGFARLDFMQKDDAVAGFFDRRPADCARLGSCSASSVSS